MLYFLFIYFLLNWFIVMIHCDTDIKWIVIVKKKKYIYIFLMYYVKLKMTVKQEKKSLNDDQCVQIHLHADILISQSRLFQNSNDYYY